VPDSPLLPFVAADPGPIQFDVAGATAAALPQVDGLLAGAAEVDITPPPGLPKAGHSVNAQDATGFRTRLRVRVVHLRAGTTSLALVAGDIHAGSTVVHHLVANAVSGDTDVRLPGLLLGATHTHAGPGQYHGCDFYNRYASNRSGFDPAYTQFLVERIAGAIRQACATRRPARLAIGSTEVWGFTRNRSLEAHIRNDSVADRRIEPQRKYAAINPWLHLLRVDARAPEGGYEPLAALAVFSIHGTGISRHDPAYNADVWAYITGELAHRIERRTGSRAVVGAMEGTHGDMTPAVRAGMLVYPEAERVGRGIAAAAAVLHEDLEAELTDDVELAAGFREIDLSVAPSLGGVSLPGPAIGTAKLAGAIENTTPLLDRVPPFRAGFPKPWGGGAQGAKWVFGGASIQRRISPPHTFPRVLPVQLLRIGTAALLALPFEITVEAGRRLEATVVAAFGEASGVRKVIVSSAANDYWDYLTTPEEYSRQCYEGASTLYGPRSHAFVSVATAQLAKDLMRSGAVADQLPTRCFRFYAHRYLPRPEGTQIVRAAVSAPRFTEATPSEDAYWEFQWRDLAPGDLAWHEPLVRIEAAGDPARAWTPAGREGWPVDDQGWHLGVVHLGADEAAGGHRYAARWYEPLMGPPVRHRFVLAANAGQPQLYSEPFD
jgi:neutral ceramidase